MKKHVFVLLLFLSAAIVPADAQRTNTYKVDLIQHSDHDYPDNPDIGHRSTAWGSYQHAYMMIVPRKNNFDLTLYPKGEGGDTIVMNNIDLHEWIPTVPDLVGADKNHTLAALVSQEWTRMELRLGKKNFNAKGKSAEHEVLSYIHLVNNSLRAERWEIVLMTEENGESKPYFHGWFTFPPALYEELFTEVNKTEYKNYKKYLDVWHTPHVKVDVSLWRDMQLEHVVAHENKNQRGYTPGGELSKKQKNIVHPTHTAPLQHYLTDSSAFAAFVEPGIYTKKQPQTAQLSRLEVLDKIYAREILIGKQKLLEFELVFHRKSDKLQTRILMGGIPRKQIPVLEETQAFKGLQKPICIGCRTCYEEYDNALQNRLKDNVFYSLLLDKDNHWLDNRAIGVEGLVFHIDSKKNLHIWVLSSERHCFVGHYMVENF